MPMRGMYTTTKLKIFEKIKLGQRVRELPRDKKKTND